MLIAFATKCASKRLIVKLKIDKIRVVFANVAHIIKEIVPMLFHDVQMFFIFSFNEI